MRTPALPATKTLTVQKMKHCCMTLSHALQQWCKCANKQKFLILTHTHKQEINELSQYYQKKMPFGLSLIVSHTQFDLYLLKINSRTNTDFFQ